jgi:hypothetical protein
VNPGECCTSNTLIPLISAAALSERPSKSDQGPPDRFSQRMHADGLPTRRCG